MRSAREYRRNIPLFFGYALFSNLIFHRGIFLLYLVALGFSGTAIGTMQATLFIANVLLELPTGIVGDRWGRKHSVVIGVLVLAVNGVGMVTVPAHCGFFCALCVFEAVGFAFISGANTALLYDSLRELGREDDYLAINARIQALGAMILGAAILVGGLMHTISWNLVYLAYSAAFVIAALCVILMRETTVQHQADDDFEQPAQTGAREYLRTPGGRGLALFIAACAIYEGAATPYFVYGQRLLTSHGLGPAEIGLFYSVVQLASGGAYMAAERIRRRLSFRGMLYGTVVLTSMGMALTAVPSVQVAVLLLFAVAVLPEAMYILCDAHLQEQTPSNVRATISSFSSMLQSLAIALGYLGCGLAMDGLGVGGALALLACAPICALMVLVAYFKRIESACVPGGQHAAQL